MTDVLTDVLGFTLQTIGGNRNTWGNINNANFQAVEKAICGLYIVTTTGGTVTLTQDQARNRIIGVSGALSSDVTIIVPNKLKEYLFSNITSGDFAVLVKTSGGTATSIPAGVKLAVLCDGAGNVERSDINEVGQMAFFGNSSVPNGWFECDGTLRSRAGRGIDLFAKVGTTWGSGNGATTFGTPDAYTAGKFLRSRTASVTVGTAQTDSNKAHTHGLTAASAASAGGHTPTGTLSTDGAHSHTISISESPHSHGTLDPGNNFVEQVANGAGSNALPTGNFIKAIPSTAAATTGISATSNSTGAHSHTVTMSAVSAHTHTLSGTTDSDGGTEARPTNLSAILCIKY